MPAGLRGVPRGPAPRRGRIGREQPGERLEHLRLAQRLAGVGQHDPLAAQQGQQFLLLGTGRRRRRGQELVQEQLASGIKVSDFHRDSSDQQATHRRRTPRPGTLLALRRLGTAHAPQFGQQLSSAARASSRSGAWNSSSPASAANPRPCHISASRRPRSLAVANRQFGGLDGRPQGVFGVFVHVAHGRDRRCRSLSGTVGFLSFSQASLRHHPPGLQLEPAVGGLGGAGPAAIEARHALARQWAAGQRQDLAAGAVPAYRARPPPAGTARRMDWPIRCAPAADATSRSRPARRRSARPVRSHGPGPASRARSRVAQAMRTHRQAAGEKPGNQRIGAHNTILPSGWMLICWVSSW